MSSSAKTAPQPASAPITSTASHAPPPGAPAGGVWGKNNYVGEKTGAAACLGCLCFCLPGLFILMCPFDERDAYRVNGKIYDASGKVIGSVNDTKFVPARR